MKVSIEDGDLVIRLPLNRPPVPSASGKTRVVASTVIYIVQRDWHMVLMTGLVLLSLALSVVVAMQR